MLLDLPPFMLPSGTRGRPAIGDLAFDGPACRQLTRPDMLTHSAVQIASLADILDRTAGIPDPVLSWGFRRFNANTRSRDVLAGSAGFIDQRKTPPLIASRRRLCERQHRLPWPVRPLSVHCGLPIAELGFPVMVVAASVFGYGPVSSPIACKAAGSGGIHLHR